MPVGSNTPGNLLGLVSGVESVEGAQRQLGPKTFFFNSLSEGIFFDFGKILGGFGKPKYSPKSIFGRFFSVFFANAISGSIFGRF